VVVALPRWCVGLAWGLVVASIIIGPMFGPTLRLPAWMQDASPFTHVPNAPAVAISVGPLAGLALVGVLLTVAGALLLRRRNLALPA
jgi:ABC-2 type transport system permease protein